MKYFTPDSRLSAPAHWIAMAAAGVLFTAAASAQTTLYVDQSDPNCVLYANVNCAGGTASTPFCLIQDAILCAQNGDTVSVAPGIYAEKIDFLGKAIHVEGTYGLTVIDGSTVATSAPVVSFQSFEDRSSILENLVVTGGNASNGAGIRCIDAGPLVRDCIVEDNYATGRGGGLYIANDTISRDAKFVRTIFRGNTADFGGGGVALESAQDDPATLIVNRSIFRDCDFEENISRFGGGIYAGGGQTTGGPALDPVFKKCRIVDNEVFFGGTGSAGGGGVGLSAGPGGTFTDCIIDDNKSEGVGGGVQLDTIDGTVFENCSIIDNVSDGDGGGLYSDSNVSVPRLTNCLIAKNVSGRMTGLGRGAGMFLNGSGVVFEHCTVADNAGFAGTGGIHVNGISVSQSFELTDSILWGNTNTNSGSTASDNYFVSSAAPALVSFSDVGGASAETWFSSTCLDVNPSFKKGYACPLAPDKDYFLVPSGIRISPCLDVGSGAAATSAIAGRVTDPNGIVDMGTLDLGFHYPRQSCP